MAKQRVHEIARALNLDSDRVISALKASGVEVKTASSSVEQAEALKALAAAGALPKKKPIPAGSRSGGSGAPARRPSSTGGGGNGGGGGADGKKRRRVVIDSQTARRDHMNQGPPQRPPRRRGRRRRPAFDESPELKTPS